MEQSGQTYRQTELPVPLSGELTNTSDRRLPGERTFRSGVTRSDGTSDRMSFADLPGLRV
ncbi:hypothetical protein [Fibrisoma limi]|uniref:hypothetical protein n=1 Tax=Fibrisoma limi TaxID=663275 RepID=UPI000310F742|nr:hypothetical protein [Fibrisoma limi]